MARLPRCATSGKLAFPTFDAAIASALKTSRIRGGLPLRAYECGCGAWHLTKNPGGRRVATVPGPFTPADMARLVARRQEESA